MPATAGRPRIRRSCCCKGEPGPARDVQAHPVGPRGARLTKVLILRPQPGADETAVASAGDGAANRCVAPLFTVRPIAWTPPEPPAFRRGLPDQRQRRAPRRRRLDAIPRPALLRGRRAHRRGGRGRGLRRCPHGSERRRARSPPWPARSGVKAAVHFCGRDHIALGPPVAADRPGLCRRRRGPAPRRPRRRPRPAPFALAAAALFRRAGRRRAATSASPRSAPQAAAAAGAGWQSIAVAAAPRDQALLELAAKLCQTGE